MLRCHMVIERPEVKTATLHFSPIKSRNLFQLLSDTVTSFLKNDGLEISGYIAYNILLSLFPFMIFLAAATRLLDTGGNILNPTDLLYRFAPAQLLDIMQPILDDILKAHQDGGVITLGIATALWASSTGIESLRVGLNRAFELPESRSLVNRRLQSIVMVLLATLTMIVMSLAIVAGPVIIDFAKNYVALDRTYELLWHVTRYSLAFITVVASFAVFYRYLPNHPHPLAWKNAISGAFFATIVWLVVATAFSYYLGSSGKSYSLTYGSLASAIILMLFFHISAAIVLLGGELNAMRLKDRDGHVQNRA